MGGGGGGGEGPSRGEKDEYSVTREEKGRKIDWRRQDFSKRVSGRLTCPPYGQTQSEKSPCRGALNSWGKRKLADKRFTT